MNKIFDCITFFRENFITNLRFEILNEVVDYFVICESIYDHKGNRKKLNFKLKNKKYANKIIYLISKKPMSHFDPWKNQAQQREYLFQGLKNANAEDYILFSDPDEIPNPKKILSLNLKKDYGIFLQKCFCYKFNIYNQYESPWEGTRVAKMKNLKSFDYMRQKILKKNLSKSIWKIHKNRNIELIDNGGWHFNSLLNPREISIKLKTFAHTEFSSKSYSDVDKIKKNISQMKDLFQKNLYYKKVKLDNSFPSFILNNKKNLREWIL